MATRDKMLGDLLEGRADVAVGNLKVLDELLADVDFVAPDEKAASVEVLVTGPASPAIRSIDELSGKTVHLREYSSQYLSLQALNQRFKEAGKPEAKPVFVPPKVTVHADIQLRPKTKLGWAIRKHSPSSPPS